MPRRKNYKKTNVKISILYTRNLRSQTLYLSPGDEALKNCLAASNSKESENKVHIKEDYNYLESERSSDYQLVYSYDHRSLTIRPFWS